MKNKKIVYVAPSLDVSGGIAIILQHANRLTKIGYDVKLLNIGPAVSEIDWFVNDVPILNSKDLLDAGKFDIVIATHYSTVKFVKKINSSRKIYFVQSDERRFDIDNIKSIAECEASYHENFEYMTEAIWIQRWLKEEFGHDAYYIPNGLDSELIHKTNLIEKKIKKIRVLLEGPIDIEWKGMADAYNAVKDLDCELWIVSSHGNLKDGWVCDKFFHRVAFDKMKEIYSSCDIFIKMSRVEGFFGPPMEAMACECAVIVGKVTGYDEYIVNEYNALVVDAGDVNAAKNAVKRLIEDDDLRAKLILNGKITASQWTWDKSISLLEDIFNNPHIDKYYTEFFPEKYKYNDVIKKILLDVAIVDNDNLKLSRETIFQKNSEIAILNDEISLIKSSKFWKIRNFYMKITGKI